MTSSHPLLLAAGIGTLALVGCRAPAPRPAEIEARARELLAGWFPEVRGPLDRAGIEEHVRALVGAEAVTAVEVPEADPATREVRRLAEEALQRGEYARARDLLVELLGASEIEAAAGVLESGDAERALAMLDRCAQRSPESARLIELRAEARLEVGRAEGEAGRELVVAALDDSLRAARAGERPEDWRRASEAAFWLGQLSEASEYSARAVAGSAARTDGGSAERARAQACAAEWRALAAMGSEPEALREPAERARRALEEYLGFAPDDVWTWRELTAVLEAHELAGRAETATRVALEFAPADLVLHERYARLALALGGRERVLAEYAGFAARHAQVALGAWFPAVQRFEAGCELVGAERDGSAAFLEAERGFERARSLDPAIEPATREYEGWCRVGAGWSACITGAIELAEQRFRSAEELVPGILGRGLEGRLASGLAGLDRLGTAWARSAEDPERPEALASLEHAGALYEYLHAYQPANADWANNAGFFLRDTAVALERQGRAECARGERARAEQRLSRARELMERSWRAYSDAVALAPEDVRLANDCALILANYLQRDAERAEELLRGAITRGEAELPALARAAAVSGLESGEQSRRQRAHEELVSAIGDAWQNLGVLHLTLRGDARTALGYLERCRNMGPDPRPEVSGPGGFLERARESMTDGTDPRVHDADRWAAPCPQP